MHATTTPRPAALPAAHAMLPEDHRGLVVSLARQLAWEAGRPELQKSLESFGRRGLTEALARFDPARGNTFATFAWWRVRGAILDGMRALGVYRRSSARPTLPLDLADAPATRRTSAPTAPDPEQILVRRQTERLVREATEQLAEPYRSLVRLSYFEDESLDRIAATFGRSRSWACRRRQEALAMLGERLAELR